jgi:hypothetical protein
LCDVREYGSERGSGSAAACIVLRKLINRQLLVSCRDKLAEILPWPHGSAAQRGGWMVAGPPHESDKIGY